MAIYVAEIGINHNGNMKNVFDLIKLAKKHGFDYVKFQKRDIDSCYTKEFLDSPRVSPFGKTQRDQKEALELSIDNFAKIDFFCKNNNIGWFYSPWDLKSAFDMIKYFKTDYVKISHASITNKALADFYKKHDVNLIISCNPFIDDIKNIPYFNLNTIDKIKYVLSCVSLYPSPINYSGLGGMDFLNRKLNVVNVDFDITKIGYSNHSSEWIFPVIAEYLGAEMIEVHITLDKNMYGSDQKASLDDDDLTYMMKFRNQFTINNSFIFDSYVEQEKQILSKLRQTW